MVSLEENLTAGMSFKTLIRCKDIVWSAICKVFGQKLVHFYACMVDTDFCGVNFYVLYFIVQLTNNIVLMEKTL